MCCVGVSQNAIGKANGFQKTIRKKNCKLGGKWAKMLKNRPKTGEKIAIYIVEKKKCRIFAGPKMGKRDVPFGKRELMFNKTKD